MKIEAKLLDVTVVAQVYKPERTMEGKQETILRC